MFSQWIHFDLPVQLNVITAIMQLEDNLRRAVPDLILREGTHVPSDFLIEELDRMIQQGVQHVLTSAIYAEQFDRLQKNWWVQINLRKNDDFTLPTRAVEHVNPGDYGEFDPDKLQMFPIKVLETNPHSDFRFQFYLTDEN